MNRTFKALSALLTYPTEELRLAAGEMSEVLDADTLIPCRVARPVTRIAPRDRYRRPLRPAGALRVAVRPDAFAVTASFRARAWRKPRSRPGDDRSQVAIRAGWIVYERQRASGFSTDVPRIPGNTLRKGSLRGRLASLFIFLLRWRSGCANASHLTKPCFVR